MPDITSTQLAQVNLTRHDDGTIEILDTYTVTTTDPRLNTRTFALRKPTPQDLEHASALLDSGQAAVDATWPRP